MCEDPTKSRKEVTERAEDELSRLICDELRTYIAPTSLRLFVRGHWPKIKVLAHKIHEN